MKNLLLFIIIIMSLFFNGFVFMKLWNWLVTYSLKLAPLSFFQSFCLIVFISYTITPWDKLGETNKERTVDEKLEKYAEIIFAKFIMLGVGYLLYINQ